MVSGTLIGSNSDRTQPREPCARTALGDTEPKPLDNILALRSDRNVIQAAPWASSKQNDILAKANMCRSVPAYKAGTARAENCTPLPVGTRRTEHSDPLTRDTLTTDLVLPSDQQLTVLTTTRMGYRDTYIAWMMQESASPHRKLSRTRHRVLVVVNTTPYPTP